MPQKRPKKRVVAVKSTGRSPEGKPFEITGPRAPLSIHFDETHSVMYVRVSHNPIATTREVNDEVLADYDKSGDLVGFEVLGYQNGRAGRVLNNLEKAFPQAASAIGQLRELVPA